MRNRPKIIFDDSCSLCNSSVSFIIRKGGESEFQFLSMHSEEGKNYLRKHGLPDNYDKSVVLLEDNKVYTRSDAILGIFKNLKGFVHLMYWLKIVPRVLRDTIYNFAARHRHILTK